MEGKKIEATERRESRAQRRVFSTWERDFGMRALLQPLEVDDTPHGDPLIGLIEPPLDDTLRLLVSQEVPTRFLRVEPDKRKGLNHSYIVEVKSCVRVTNWGYLVTTTILQTLPYGGDNPSA